MNEIFLSLISIILTICGLWAGQIQSRRNQEDKQEMKNSIDTLSNRIDTLIALYRK